MEPSGSRRARRITPLSVASIVEAALEILDAGGEDALTFRVLADRLQTGPGAIYHHVANKQDLLAIVTTQLMRSAVAHVDDGVDGGVELRRLLLNVFDAIDTHPWVGSQLAAAPWQGPVMTLFEAIGVRLDVLAVPARHQFSAASALVNFVLGVAAQYASAARVTSDRADLLASVAARWQGEQYPFTSRVSAQLAEHDDRQQFAEGVDFLLAGIRGNAVR